MRMFQQIWKAATWEGFLGVNKAGEGSGSEVLMEETAVLLVHTLIVAQLNDCNSLMADITDF